MDDKTLVNILKGYVAEHCSTINYVPHEEYRKMEKGIQRLLTPYIKIAPPEDKGYFFIYEYWDVIDPTDIQKGYALVDGTSAEACMDKLRSIILVTLTSEVGHRWDIGHIYLDWDRGHGGFCESISTFMKHCSDYPGVVI